MLIRLIVRIVHRSARHAWPVVALFVVLVLPVSSLVTLDACVLLHRSPNFASIIALPLLLGVGVAFEIYDVAAWRDGQPVLLGKPRRRPARARAHASAAAASGKREPS